MELQVGDEIIVKPSYGRMYTTTVKKLTPTQIVVDRHDTRIKKPFYDGCTAIGSNSYSPYRYYIPSEELIREMATEEALLKISKINFTKLTLEKLNDIINISES